MASIGTEETILGIPFPAFATSRLSLYAGPQVTIRIGSANREYNLPKALLCRQSPYFAAMFEGQFKEGEEQSTTLEEIEGVVSTRSFQMLAQWVMLGRIIFEDSPADEGISAVIEFARFADMCGLLDIEHLMAQRIEDVIIADAALRHDICRRNPNANTYLITSQHILSAVNLPVGHPVRNTLAMAAVEGYLLLDNHKFAEEYREIPGFAADLLAAVRQTVKTISHGKYSVEFQEPLKGTILSLQQVDPLGYTPV
ncbi:hypothetical protein PVAG01_08625 [Phlyctema vagabunda]|uniref:BTB domain-containing protein n=1 Tax=Phlyctema vagabunda TaxID=108571 RepID=A0ABR4PAL0_9HELO